MISNFNDKSYWLEQHILKYSEQIDEYFDQIESIGRGQASKQILLILRHFVEAIDCYIAIGSPEFTSEIITTQKEIKERSISYIGGRKANNDFYFCLYLFHEDLQKAVSHEAILYGDYAERLVLKYFDYLIKIKFYFKQLKINVLLKLNKYPIQMDESLISFYKVIANEVNLVTKSGEIGVKDKYYIDDKKIKYVDGKYFYEYTISTIDDNKDKADKIIAFSEKDIFDNYAVELQIIDREVMICNVKTTIQIIVEYDVAIRNCEFDKLIQILNLRFHIRKTNEEYRLMSYIKDNRVSLADIVKMKQNEFDEFAKSVLVYGRETKLAKVILTARHYINEKVFGYVTLLYLLASMNNALLESQLIRVDDTIIENSPLLLSTSIYPFESTPFCSNLRDSIVAPKILFRTIDLKGHECELIKREIDNYSRDNSLIYCNEDYLLDIPDIREQINNFNRKIRNYGRMRIDAYTHSNKNYYYVADNEKTFLEIFGTLKSYFSNESIPNYRNFALSRIQVLNKKYDDQNKEIAIKEAFNSKSAFICYGPAGTGKSFFINELLDIVGLENVLCVTSTYASLGNLKRRLANKNVVYSVVEKIVRCKTDYYKSFDMVVIDECSTISNRDFLKLLKKINPKLLLLVGDIYQIESIEFGNWFSLMREFLPPDCYCELNNCFRTTNKVLETIWKNVRNIEPQISEAFKTYEISFPIGEKVFTRPTDENEVTLCLNYGGLYGINNINKIMQANNKNDGITRRQHTYKVGDPIVFKETSYYKDIFYNNLRGVIIKAIKSKEKMTFTVEVKETLKPEIAFNPKVRNVEFTPNKTTIVTFDVYLINKEELEDDLKPSKVVPFSVCYALSIHKAQGLEYNKVNVVISGEVREVISHNIFYTAITRAVNSLCIYWSPESEKSVISNLKLKNYKTDALILRSKFEDLNSLKKTYYLRINN